MDRLSAKKRREKKMSERAPEDRVLRPLPPSARAQAAALRSAFPGYIVNVITGPGDKPRYEVVNRNGGDPYCLMSSDAREIWRELRSPG
jgi:hypothetical protein